MDSEKIHLHVQYLEQKIMRLLEQCRNQEEIIRRLQKEPLIQQVSSSAETAYDFSNQLELGTMTKGENAIRAWEAKIDGYISDIDRSIAYLEQLP